MAHVFAGIDRVFTRASHNSSPGYVKRLDPFKHYDKRIKSSSACLFFTRLIITFKYMAHHRVSLKRRMFFNKIGGDSSMNLEGVLGVNENLCMFCKSKACVYHVP